MAWDDKAKGNARKLLAAEVERARRPNSVVARVEALFDEIKVARQRFMPWAQIARALEDGEKIKVDAVSSAFERMCKARGEPVWGARRSGRKAAGATPRQADKPPTYGQSTDMRPTTEPPTLDLYGGRSRFAREVDDGE